MPKKLTKQSFDKFKKDFANAMNEGTAKLLVSTQGKLSGTSPVDTGRLASSWMIGKDSVDPSIAAEREKGTTRVSTEPYDGEITFTGEWHLSNSLPYAKTAAYDPGYVGKVGGGQGDWFTSVQNNLTRTAKATFDGCLKQVK